MQVVSDLERLSEVISKASSSDIWLCQRISGDFDLAELEGLRRDAERAAIRIDVAPAVLERLIGKNWLKNPSLEWRQSRAALADVWRSAISSNPAAIGLSLSHTKGAWVAAARAVTTSGSACIGVDLELSGRTISERLHKRFRNPRDDCPGLSHLGLWTIKEALFKADLVTNGQTLIDYVALLVEQNGMFLGTGTSPNGRSYAACFLGTGPKSLGVAAEINRPMR